jgi:DNA-directed RNA polymerase subunit K/omega
MTYIRRKDVTDVIENKFEAIKVAALEARRLNDRARTLGVALPGKLTTTAIQRLIDGKIEHFDQRERLRQLQEENEQAEE